MSLLSCPQAGQLSQLVPAVAVFQCGKAAMPRVMIKGDCICGVCPFSEQQNFCLLNVV